jgi:hypothetical protein
MLTFNLSWACCPVQLVNFLSSTLGYPLSVTRLSKSDLQPLVDKVAGHVPTWKASLMKKSGMFDSLGLPSDGYTMLSLDLPLWFFKCIDKLLRGFSGQTPRKLGEDSVVSWKAVCTPKSIGGLGMKNLCLLNLVLHMRWCWL